MEIIIYLVVLLVFVTLVQALAGLYLPFIVLIAIVTIVLILSFRHHKKQLRLLEEEKKKLPFSKNLKVGDEIYPDVVVVEIYLDQYLRVWVTGLEYGKSLFTEGGKFRYKNSPWTTEIVAINVVAQTVTVRCY